MITVAILIIKAFLLGWFISFFEPLQLALGKIKEKIKTKNPLIQYVKDGVSCHKCLAMWSAVALSPNMTGFYCGVAAAVIVYAYDMLMLKLR